MRKLTAEVVIDMRRMYNEGMSITELSIFFKIGKHTVDSVVHHRSWRHVPDEKGIFRPQSLSSTPRHFIKPEVPETPAPSNRECKPFVELLKPREKARRSRMKRKQSRISKPVRNQDYIYFIRARIGGPIKIGKSNNPEGRLSDIQVSNPYLLELLAIVPGSESLEKHLHGIFASSRLQGEWFAPSDELLALVKQAQDGVFPVEYHLPKTSIEITRELFLETA